MEGVLQEPAPGFSGTGQLDDRGEAHLIALACMFLRRRRA